ncbi:MAG: 3-hydroxyacyl-ACP dehydratase FabZ family protein [Phycisphaerae bacterium]
MPPPLIVDLAQLDLNAVAVDHDELYKCLPQRYEFEMLSHLIYVDRVTTTIVGVKHITKDDFWVRGHIPGRPLMPGVMMLECAAQLCAYGSMLAVPDNGFIGFARANDIIFRGAVVPPNSLYMVSKLLEATRRRCIGQCQGFCDGKMVFEATITGMPV